MNTCGRTKTWYESKTKLFTGGLFVGALIVLFYSFGLSLASAATLSLNPPSGTYVEGDTISIDVLVATNERINAISGEIIYPSDILEPLSISKTNSIVDLWLEEPAVLRGSNTIVFEGLILNPGFTGTGKVITLQFEVLTTGEATLAFDSGLVLANDGFGTNVLETLSPARFSLLKGQDTSSALEQLPNTETLFSEDDDEFLAPVVISYTASPQKLGDLVIRGVTYPNTRVNVFLEGDDSAAVQYGVLSDAGGNFIYEHEHDENIQTLPLANVFSILTALGGQKDYTFWLTAVRDNVETETTQAFAVNVVGALGSVQTTILIILILLAVLIISVLVSRWYTRKHARQRVSGTHPSYKPTSAEGRVLGEIKKSVYDLAYDVEKYSAHARQEEGRKDYYERKRKAESKSSPQARSRQQSGKQKQKKANGEKRSETRE